METARIPAAQKEWSLRNQSVRQRRQQQRDQQQRRLVIVIRPPRIHNLGVRTVVTGSPFWVNGYQSQIPVRLNVSALIRHSTETVQIIVSLLIRLV